MFSRKGDSFLWVAACREKYAKYVEINSGGFYVCMYVCMM